MGLCLAGIPTALSQPAANELLMARVPARRRGFAFAVKQSAIPVSGLPLLALATVTGLGAAAANALGTFVAVSAGYLLLAAGHQVTFLMGLVLGFGAGWAWPGVFNYSMPSPRGFRTGSPPRHR